MNVNQKATNAMRNNLNAARTGMSGIVKAQFVLRALHVCTGMTQQALLSRCILHCFECDPMFAPFRKAIEDDWKRTENKKAKEEK